METVCLVKYILSKNQSEHSDLPCHVMTWFMLYLQGMPGKLGKPGIPGQKGSEVSNFYFTLASDLKL